MMKGQTQAVTAVMITGVMIGAVASAYVWGTPLLDKRESEAEVKQLHNDVVALQEEAEYISEAGELAASEEELRVNDGSVNVVPGENLIRITKPADTSMYPKEAWQLISGKGRISGAGSLGIHSRTAAFAQLDGDDVVYELRFRDLEASSGGETQNETIDLQDSPESGGNTVVVIENQGTEVKDGGNEIQTNLGVRLR